MKNSKTTKEEKIFHSIDEIISEYLPADQEKEQIIVGDYGKKLADDTMERVRKTIIIHKQK